MRLTLRTLLAYLDDILEPADARELGEKIHESPLATTLVNKIQDVVRRRRVGAPHVSGPGSDPDPNIVAEYLDNTLPPQVISELERMCLESDQHLAEVAACHQILTLVLGKTVEVPPRLREQMYALGAVAAAPDEGNGAPRHVPKVVGVGAADLSRDVQPRSGEHDLLSPLPARISRGRGWKRAAPYAVAAVILAGWAYLIITDYFPGRDAIVHAPDLPAVEPAGGRGAPPVQAAAPADGRIPPPEGAGDAAGVNEPIDVELDADDAATVVLPPGVPPAPSGTRNDDAIAADDLFAPLPAEPDSDAAAGETDAAEPGAPVGDAAVAVGPEQPQSPQVEVAPPGPHAPAVPPPLEPVQIQYASTEGILVHRETADGQWAVTPRRALIFPDEDIACPEPFEARLSVADRGVVCEILLRGGTRVRSLAPTAQTRMGWEIDRGRVVVSRRGTEPTEQPLVFRLKIRSDEWLCELAGAEVLLGIEVNSVPPAGVGDLRGATSYVGGMQLISGSAKLTHMGTQRVIDLIPEHGALVLGTDLLEPQEASQVPGWIAGGSGASSLSRHFSVKFEKEFLPDQPVAASIRPVVKDKQPRISELATGTLVLTDNLPGMVDALSAPHEESRVAAIEGLRRWLPRGEEHGEQLDAELQNRFREATAAAISRLLWGYVAQDLRDKGTAEELVQWLLDDEIAVRELAFFHVRRLTGRTYGYRADRRADEREAAVRHWRERLEKSGGLVSE